MEAAKARIPEESYNRCLFDIEKLRNPVAVPFHWKDGGKFKCERDEEEQEQVQEEDGLCVEQVVPDNLCAQGYKRINEWATERARKGTIAVESMVMFTSYVKEESHGEALGGCGATW